MRSSKSLPMADEWVGPGNVALNGSKSCSGTYLSVILPSTSSSLKLRGMNTPWASAEDLMVETLLQQRSGGSGGGGGFATAPWDQSGGFGGGDCTGMYR